MKCVTIIIIINLLVTISGSFCTDILLASPVLLYMASPQVKGRSWFGSFAALLAATSHFMIVWKPWHTDVTFR